MVGRSRIWLKKTRRLMRAVARTVGALQTEDLQPLQTEAGPELEV